MSYPVQILTNTYKLYSFKLVTRVLYEDIIGILSLKKFISLAKNSLLAVHEFVKF